MTKSAKRKRHEQVKQFAKLVAGIGDYSLLDVKSVSGFPFGGPEKAADGVPSKLTPNLPVLPPEAPRGPQKAKEPGFFRIHYPCSAAILLNNATGQTTKITYSHTAKGFVGGTADRRRGTGDPTFTIHAAFGHRRKLTLTEFAKVALERYGMPRLPDILAQVAGG